MKTLLKQVIKLIVMLSISVFVFACGESDGDGVNRTPAVITSDNAEILTKEAYSGGYSGTGLSGSKSVDEDQGNVQMILKVGEILKKFGETNDFKAISDSKSKGGEKIYGNCGGSADVSYSETDTTETLTMNMQNFCEDDTTLSGALKVVYTYAYVNGYYELTSIEVTYSNTDISEYGYSIIVNGTATINYQSDTQVAISMNQIIKDQYTGKLYGYDNYKIQGSKYLSTIDILISGSYANPDHGMVTISTPVTISENTNGPYSGELLIEGANGTSAKLHFLSSETYSVECDGDGDGTNDWESGILNRN